MADCFWQDLVKTFEDCVGGCTPYLASFEQSDHSTPTYGTTQFGYCSALDGDTAAVGSWRAYPQTGGEFYEGMVFTYIYEDGAWAVDQALRSTAPSSSDSFGKSVDLDGDYLVTCASSDDDNGSSAGCGYVFFRSGGTWAQQQKLLGTTTAAGDQTDAISISGDSVLMGAWSADHTALSQAGEAFVFTRSGTTWTEQQRLEASDAAGSDLFGNNVCIDGDTAFVAATHRDYGGDSNVGAVYVFTRSGSTWTEQDILLPSAPDADIYFGSDINVKGDTLLITGNGAMVDFIENRDTYVFMLDDGDWVFHQLISSVDCTAISDDELRITGGHLSGPSPAAFEMPVYTRTVTDGLFALAYTLIPDGSEEMTNYIYSANIAPHESGDKLGVSIISYGDDLQDDQGMHFFDMTCDPS